MSVEYFAAPQIGTGATATTAEFTTVGISSPFQAPAGTISVEIDNIGAGAGGGGGRFGASGSVISGGGGGSSGCRNSKIYLLTELAAIVGVPVADLWFAVEIGAGGLGGVTQGAANTNGNPAGSGGTARVYVRNASNTINKVLMAAAGGSPGAVGTTTGSVAGGGIVPSPGTYPGSAGGSGVAGFGSNASTANDSASGGGGGSGHNGALSAKVGGAGGGGAQAIYGQIVQGTSSGLSASSAIPPRIPGAGGGGAPANADGSVGVAGNGFRGGGGGGGAGGTLSGGAGGNGGNGYAYFIWRNS